MVSAHDLAIARVGFMFCESYSHGPFTARGHAVLQKKRSSSSFWMEIMSTTAVEGFCHYVLISKFLLPNCSGFETSENQDLAANEYLAEPFEKLWPTLFVCVQNFTSVFMVETAQSVVVTAQRGRSNCAAAQLRGNIGWEVYILNNKLLRQIKHRNQK